MTVCTPPPAARRAFRSMAGLTPLLLSLAVCNAYATDVTIVGRNGADGAQGVLGPTPNGGEGQSAPLAQYLFGSQDARNTLSLYGGNGGAGGDGADAGTVMQTECNQSGSCHEVTVYYDAGYGAGGSNGAQAIGSVTTRSGATSGVAESRVTGGAGGSSSRKSTNWSLQDFANIGNGGDATSVASVFVTGAASAEASAYATGGNGAFSAETPVDSSSNGGRALARAYGQSGTGAVTVLAAANGGVAGIAKLGAGGAALIDAVSGSTSGTLTLTQRVQGAASDQLFEFPRGDSDASSSLTLSDARASRLSATVEAIGGDGSRQFIGGNATATLTLSSTRAGAALDGTVAATGGTRSPSYEYADPAGRNAEARATLTGLGAVTGSATATGGSARGPVAGAALASLTLSGPGMVSGNASARGGYLIAFGPDQRSGHGTANATLTMAGAGAQGLALASGSDVVTSTVNVNTSGALAVDVASRAEHAASYSSRYDSAELNATTIVAVQRDGGQAAVTAAASADGLSASIGNARSTVRVVAAGDIGATGYSKAGYFGNYLPVSGGASSSVRAETSGQHAVTASATALVGTSDDAYNASGGAVAADAYGRSGSGVVNARAEARGIATADARAVAVTLERGGVSNARAIASARYASVSMQDVHASASMSALDRQGRTLTIGGFAAGMLSESANAASSSQFSPSSLALGALGDGAQASVMAAPERAALLAAVPQAAPLQNAVGAGMHAMGHSRPFNEWAGLSHQHALGQFQFFAEAGEHLQVFFLSGSGGFDIMDLSITNNGTELFSRAFDAASAQQFFNGYLLDLGALGAGMQDLRISSSMLFYQPGSYAFNYLVGTAAGTISAVPEASTWLLLLVGMGGLVLVARRRRVSL